MDNPFMSPVGMATRPALREETALALLLPNNQNRNLFAERYKMADTIANAETVGVDATQLLGNILAQGVARAAADVITGDEVEFHDSPKIILPRGTTYSRAQEILQRIKEEQETPTEFSRQFPYRPDDGAYAVSQVIKEMFGLSLGKARNTFFGVIPAETRTITIGPKQKMQVPWGLIEVPTLEGLQIYLREEMHKKWGAVFAIHAAGPKKYQKEMDRLFDGVASYLETNSIYKGRAIFGGNHPEFLDLDNFNPEQVIFSDEVTNTLEGTLWGPIRYADAMSSQGIPLKRSILLHGPYGTGKTSTGMITALEATKAGWTYIAARAGRDKPEDVLMTARLYEPAVVFIEDIDTNTSSGEDEEVTRFLDAFDGIASKGGKIMAVMTTNHVDRVHKGMLRPGRLDAVIEVAELDRNGVERLVKAIVDSKKLDPDVDYDKVYAAMAGFLPAFIREAVNRSIQFSITRLGGSVEYIISTDDLVNAALSLHSQLGLLNEASEGRTTPTLDAAFSEMVAGAAREAVTGLYVDNTEYGSHDYICDPDGEDE